MTPKMAITWWWLRNLGGENAVMNTVFGASEDSLVSFKVSVSGRQRETGDRERDRRRGPRDKKSSTTDWGTMMATTMPGRHTVQQRRVRTPPYFSGRRRFLLPRFPTLFWFQIYILVKFLKLDRLKFGKRKMWARLVNVRPPLQRRRHAGRFVDRHAAAFQCADLRPGARS